MGFWSGPQGTGPQGQEEKLRKWDRLAATQVAEYPDNVAVVRAINCIEEELIRLGEGDWLAAQ